MTAAAQITNPAQESSRAGIASPEVQAILLENLERVAPGCGPVFGPVSDEDAKNLRADAVAPFCVSFHSAARRIVFFALSHAGRIYWGMHEYRTPRTRKPKSRAPATNLAVHADNVAYDLKSDVRDWQEKAGGLELVAGDVVVASYGYDQTNISFYKVLKVTPSGQSATIVAIGQTRNEAEMAMAGTTTPLVDVVEGEPQLRRMYDRTSLIGSRYAGALLRKWDGKPCRYTSYA